MLRVEGEQRSHRQNQHLAGYLALVAGLVNSSGFVLLGAFTSHVTGNVGRFANDLATSDLPAAARAGAMLLVFFLGSFFGSLVIESTPRQRRTHVYGSLLFVEAGLLGSFFLVASVAHLAGAGARDLQALTLCAAMGLQNCLVTRLSGAVVRTTHLTGVMTDLGIEAARWARYVMGGKRAMASAASADRPRRAGETPAPVLPHPLGPKSALLLTILVTFLVGSIAGAVLAVSLHRLALLAPLALLVLGGFLGFVGPQDVVHDTERR